MKNFVHITSSLSLLENKKIEKINTIFINQNNNERDYYYGIFYCI